MQSQESHPQPVSVHGDGYIESLPDKRRGVGVGLNHTLSNRELLYFLPPYLWIWRVCDRAVVSPPIRQV
ncbi:hypothetical protein H6H02_11420 [Coleofasciculus sp. FACHB-1120]|nr:hypothetical protein [Coleofasciculus sp. FACHB-1120]